MTDSTLVRALFSTQSNARVSTGQGLVTWLITRGTVTGLMAELAAGLVLTLPCTGLHTGTTGLATKPEALTVNTAILTFTSTWKAGRAGSLAFVRADEKTLTFMGTVAVVPTRVTKATLTTTHMTTFQYLFTGGPTWWLFVLCFVKAKIRLAVATLQLKLNLYFA